MPDRSTLTRHSNFVDLLRERVSTHPDRAAFAFLQDGSTETERWTYADLDQRARTIAGHLQMLGLSGKRAVLLYNPGLDFVAGFFGCLYADVTAVPAYPPRSNPLMERLSAIIRDADVAVALTASAAEEGIAQRLRELGEYAPAKLIATDTLHEEDADPWRPKLIRPDNLAFLQYTSGSTGHPKGVMVSHANLLHNSQLIHRCFEDSPESLGVSWLPPYHDMGLVGGILQSLYVGSTTFLMPPVAFLQRPIRWLEAISRHRATTAGGPNFAYEFCARQIRPEQLQDLDLSSWSLAFTGAEPVRAETLDRFCDIFGPCGFRREAFLPCYGLAENTLIVTGGGRRRLPVVRHFDSAALTDRRVVELTSDAATARRTLVSSGPRVGDVGLQVVDPETGMALGPGQIGEIWVSGASVAQGYRRQPERSRETFQARLAGDEADYLRTGDLGFVLDGELFVNGRLKDLIIIRGSNHYPQDIEASVETSHRALRTGCGAAFSVELDGEEKLVVVQEVERSALRRLDADAVTAAIRAALSQKHQLQPAAVLLLKTGSIPKTSSGKIQRFACRQNYLQGSLQTVGIWREPASGGTTGAGGAASSASGRGGASAPVCDGQPRPAVSAMASRERQIHTWFREYLAEKLGLAAEAIDVDRPLAQYGLDSMAAVRLTADLEDWLALTFPERPSLPLSPTLAYDHPTIARIAATLAPGEVSNPDRAVEPASPHAAVGRSLRDDDIAVVGIGCRFPGAASPEAFWELLQGGGDAIRTATAAAALDRGFGGPPAERAGFLDDIDLFDASFFDIPEREAEQMDPQQRLLLETTWEAFEQAGIAPERWAGSKAGVFVGISSSDYAQLQPLRQRSVYWGTGNAHSIAANRLSYLFDLRGPSLAVDTACSSSLVAVHQAVRSLQLGECTQAVAAGVNILLMPALTETFRQAGMLAPDGRCKPFDADADGYVRGEGCGVVLLKRLADARRNGDRVWGVIGGSAINQDGRSNGLTAPNGLAQQSVVREALQRAGVSPAAISYVEAHGTGTSLGDPIEVNALCAVLAAGRASDQPCWLGSVKANLGHLEAAAGMAGLIKVLLCFEHGQLPQHLHLRRLNPLIQLEQTPFAINTTPQPWQGSGRWAGISSFGFGGTNAHLILAPPPDGEDQPRRRSLPDRPCHLLTLSARSPQALQELQGSHAALLADPDLTVERLGDHCYSANVGRSHLPFRSAWIGGSAPELVAALSSDGPSPQESGRIGTLAFLFTGQGSQYPGMAGQLLESQPVFGEAIDTCAAILAELEVLPQGLGLRQLLQKPADEAEEQRIAAVLERTAVTQPVLFSLEVALARLWMSWGVHPDWVMGHSVGEYAAACVAGVFDLVDGLRLIAARARLMEALPAGGGMLAVFADASTVAALLAGLGSPLVIAADNGPGNVVVSGPLEAIEALEPVLIERGLVARRLRVSHAFHSPLMEPMLAEFGAIAAAVTFREPSLPIVSNLTHEPIGAAMAGPDYWCRHVTAPVAFGASLQTLRSQGVDAFLEIGPKPTLVEMGRAGGLHPEARWLESLRPGRPDTRQLLESLAELYRFGAEIHWAGFDAPFSRRRVSLPTYPWQRRRHWLDTVRPTPAGSAAAPTAAPLSSESADPDLYAVAWRQRPLPPLGPGDAPPLGHWLLTGSASLLEGLEQALPAGQGCIRIEEAAAFQQVHPRHWRLDPASGDHWRRLLDTLDPTSPILGILQVVETSPGPTPAEGSAELEEILRRSMRLPALVHALLERRWQTAPPRLWWLCPREGDGPGDPASTLGAGIAQGFGRSLALEHPELWGGWLEVPDLGTESGMALLIRELAEAWKAPGPDPSAELQVLHRSGERLVQRLTRLPTPAGTARPEAARLDGHVLISGGLGALGLATSEWLVARGVPSLILVGRRPPPPETMARLESWRRQGTDITVVQADVSDAGFIPQLSATLDDSPWPLRGIVHAAGVLEDTSVERLEAEGWQRVLQPKLLGAWQLHQLSLAHPVEVFVLYSSLASLLGSPGQSAYGAANAGLDSLAAWRRGLGLPALSVNWGPWSGSGMAERGLERSGRSLESLGVVPQPPGAYLKLLGSLLFGSADRNGPLPADLPANLGVARMRLEFIGRLLGGRPQGAFLADLTPTEAPAASPAGDPGLRAQLLAEAPQARATTMLAYLRRTLSRLLGMDAKQIDPELHLMEAAADSLMVMDAISQIQKDLGLMIYPREIYEHPRVGSLASYLAEAFSFSQGEAGLIQPPAASADLPAALRLPASARSRPVPPAAKLPAAIFVLSSPRAGSTLLRVMLAGHPQLFSPPELHLLPFASMGERAEALGQSHLGEGLERALMDLQGADVHACRRVLKSWEEEDRSIASVYRQLQELAAGRILVDKSPTYALHQETLQQAEASFNQPRYIHLVRHPCAVIRSFVDLRMDRLFGAGDGDPYHLAETIWRTCNQNVQQLHDQLGDQRVRRVLYEDLVRSPEDTLTDLCEFLAIPFDPALLAPYEGSRLTDGPHIQSLSVGDPNFRRHRGIDASLAESWRRAELPWPLQASTARLAEGFGYTLPRESASVPVVPTRPASQASGAGLAAPAATPPLAMREEFVEVGGLRLCRCEWGPEDGHPVLCLHGLLDQGLLWAPVAVQLAAAGFRVIAPDLRGHGRSDHVGPGGTYQILDFISDAVALVDRILDRPFTLIGHSLGTVVASGLASLREAMVERLVLIEPVLPSSATTDDVRDTVNTLVSYALEPPRHRVMPDRATAAARLRRAMASLSSGFAERLVERVTRQEGEGWVWRWDAVLQTRMSLNLQGGPLHRSAYLRLLEGLRPQLTVVQGETSAFNRPEDLQALRNAMPSARRLLLDGGHNLILDNPEDLGAALLQVLGVGVRS